MKYIIFEAQSGLDVPILFPDFLSHSTVAENFRFMKPVSAGFVKIGTYIEDMGEIQVSGKSVTLQLESRITDETLIERALKNFAL